MRRSTRYAAIGLAVAAVAVSGTAAVALPREAAPTQRAAVTLLADHKGIPRRCYYPPQAAPHVTLTAIPNPAKKNEKITFEGFVTLNDCPLDDVDVRLYSSTSSTGRFKKVDDDETNSSGKFRITGVRIKKTTYFYVVTERVGGLQRGTSAVLTVTIAP